MANEKEKPILVVTAHKTRVPAKLLRLNKNGTADLEVEYRGETHTITSSPRDEEGKKPDSWDYAVEGKASTKDEAKEDAPPAK